MSLESWNRKAAWTAFALCLAATAAMASETPIQVLHVSAYGLDELEHMLEVAGCRDRFQIHQVLLDQGLPEGWSRADVICFGLSDCYEAAANEGAPQDAAELDFLRDYVLAGGGIVWTHDTLEWGADWGAAVNEPAGILPNGGRRIGMDNGRLEIVRDHPILQQPFSIGRSGDRLSTARLGSFPHSGGGLVEDATVIVRHAQEPAPDNFYLTVKEYGRGRVVVSQVGHSVVGFRGRLNLHPSMDEARLLANALLWAAGSEANRDPQANQPTLRIGETLDLSLLSPGYTWESSDPEVLVVDAYGALHGVREGTVLLKARDAEGRTQSMLVRVGSDRDPEPAVDPAPRRLPFRSRGHQVEPVAPASALP